MASVDLSSLEERIRLLEEKIGLSSEPSKQSCVEMLMAVSEKLSQVKATREAMSQIWTQMGNLKSYLDPQLEAKATVTDTVKADMVLAGEQHIRQVVDRLKAVHILKAGVNPSPLQSLPTFASRLQPLVHVHIGQQAATETQSEDMAQLLTAYNELISVISCQTVEWDHLLLTYEEKYQENR